MKAGVETPGTIGSRAAEPFGACRICGGRVVFGLRVRERMAGTREAFDYHECPHCRCLQIAAIPSDLERFYEAGYYTDAQLRRPRGMGPAWLCSLRRRWFHLRLAIARRAGLRLGRRYAGLGWFVRTETGLDDEILDVGCGSGRLLERMARAGFTRLTGIDERLCAERAGHPGPRLLRVALEEYVGRHHLVMAHHSFEHVRDPRAAFRAFARLVEPGGWLLLRTPVADGEARRRYAEDWVQIDAPRHLHLHTRASIEVLAGEVGFRLAHVEDDSGPFQVWGSELYRRDVALSEAGRGGAGVFGWPARLAFRWRARRWRRAGRGDQACFYLQRTGRVERVARTG
jgi:SAM-dependent methyltransferase